MPPSGAGFRSRGWREETTRNRFQPVSERAWRRDNETESIESGAGSMLSAT
jgi:hypothetical protein